MKQILFFIFSIFSIFTASAEFGAWRKAGVKCGTGQNALGCIISGLKAGDLSQKLNCPEGVFLQEVASCYNKQAGTNFSGEDARNAFIDGQMFIVEWPAGDLMNSGLKAGQVYYFPMTGNGEVKVIASKDLSGRTIPLVKAEGTGGQACFNVCYSKSMKPYTEPEPKKDPPPVVQPPVVTLPPPTVTLPPPVLQQQPQGGMIVLDWPNQPIPGNLPVVSINPVYPVQVPTTFLPQQNCCGNRGWGAPPVITPAPNPGNNGHPVEGDPGWGGNITTAPNPGPIVHGNGTPTGGEPGWGGYTTQPGNSGFTIGGNNGGGSGGSPVE